MWLMVMFDLPVLTREDKRQYRIFVDRLEDNGFVRIQYSIFARPCATEENTEKHIGRLREMIPPLGQVRILRFTDKQWARTVVFHNASLTVPELPPEQFTFFDDDLVPVDPVLMPDPDGSNAEEDALRIEVILGGEAVRREVAGVYEPEVPYDAAPRPKGKRTAKGGKKKRRPENQTPSFDFFD